MVVRLVAAQIHVECLHVGLSRKKMESRHARVDEVAGHLCDVEGSVVVGRLIALVSVPLVAQKVIARCVQT
jgi:hypothetical protein